MGSLSTRLRWTKRIKTEPHKLTCPPSFFVARHFFSSLAIFPILFLIIYKLIPLPDPNYRNPTADELLAGLSGYHVAPGSNGGRPVVPLRERAFDPTKYEQKVAKCKAKEIGTGWLFAREKEVEIEIREYLEGE